MSNNTTIPQPMTLTEMCFLSPIEVEDLFFSLNEENVTLDEFLESHGNMCNQIVFERIISIIVPIVFTIIFLVGIIGNVLVLIVVLLKHQMRNTTNVLIVVSNLLHTRVIQSF